MADCISLFRPLSAASQSPLMAKALACVKSNASMRTFSVSQRVLERVLFPTCVVPLGLAMDGSSSVADAVYENALRFLDKIRQEEDFR